MIIFGWGRRTVKDCGVTFKYHCDNCRNDEHWVLTHVMTWFTLFFVPIFPYSTKYFLSCPVCNYGSVLNQSEANEFIPIAELNQLLIEGKITQEEYQTKMDQLQSANAKVPEANNE